MITYDEGFDPPALVVTAALSGVAEERLSADIEALIDTGADITAVPDHLEERLDLYPFSRIQMEDARGHQAAVNTYEVIIDVANRGPLTMEVILVPFPFAILGRDWLQRFYLLLNGPEQRFLLSENPIVAESE